MNFSIVIKKTPELVPEITTQYKKAQKKHGVQHEHNGNFTIFKKSDFMPEIGRNNANKQR